MPEFILDGTHDAKYRALDSFTQGYIQALFFTDIGPGTTTEEWQKTDDHAEGSIPSDVGFTDLDSETLARIVLDCKRFQAYNLDDLANAQLHAENNNFEYDDERAGMDFWYTRNGHGCGYWDRNLGEIGERLTTSAKTYGEVWSYLSDAGKVCLS